MDPGSEDEGIPIGKPVVNSTCGTTDRLVSETITTTTTTTERRYSEPKRENQVEDGQQHEAKRQKTSGDEYADHPPSMTGRSEIEFRCSARLLEVLLTSESATLRELWAVLRRGDAMERTDGVFKLAGNKFLMFEWDGGVFHTSGAVAKDMRKTLRMLKVCPSGLVVRVRADGAPPLDDAIAENVTDPVDRSRIVVVHLTPQESRNVGLAVRAIARKVGPVLALFGGVEQSTFVSRLESAAVLSDACARAQSHHANDLVFETYKLVDEALTVNLEALVAILGTEEAARRVLETGGVITRLPHIITALKRFRDDFGVSVSDLPSLMNDGVTAAVEHESFWTAVERVRDEIPGVDLNSFLKNGVACRIESDTFWTAVQRVRDEIPGVDLNSFLKDGVACRIESDGSGTSEDRHSWSQFEQVSHK